MKKLLLVLGMLALFAVPVHAENTISVAVNGKALTFDVQPVLMNDRTMVPMRAIFEVLGAEVYYTDYTETVSAYHPASGSIVLPISANTATVNGKPIELDQPAVLKDGRTLVPIRFVAEALGCTVNWEDKTQSVVITQADTQPKDTLFYGVSAVTDMGSWMVENGIALRGLTQPGSAKDAVLQMEIPETGKYKVWVLSRDYPENKQGSRYFNIAIDGKTIQARFGTHGKEGFQWTEAGEFSFEQGAHEVRLQDTSCFYARWGGLLVTPDLAFVPSEAETNYMQTQMAGEKAGAIIPSAFPQWANGAMHETATETIENDTIKIVFYQGATNRGGLVQNEIFLKQDGAWTQVKARNEDLGVLAMRNNDGTVSTQHPPYSNLWDTPWESRSVKIDTYNGEYAAIGVTDFYKMGAPEWLIPYAMTRLDNKTVQLSMTSEHVDGTLTYTFDDFTYEPKVTFHANIKKDGGYSFVHFTGADFKETEFTQVTAPLMYTKDFVPEGATVLAEYMMFTPMVTFTFGEGEHALTKGIVIDPSCVRAKHARPGDAEYGILFRAPNGNVRGQIAAPLLGAKQSVFKVGDSYSFSYRLVYAQSDWYENYVHIAQDLFNCVDLRTNYYASLNDAIYNTTDLMLDDMYGGWDDKDMAFYNMEAEMVTTLSNGVEMMQRYLLTENEEILDERAVPGLAFMLSRGAMHFNRIEKFSWYAPVTPVPLAGVNKGFGPSTYLALYRMSQGRTPFLMQYALSELDKTVGVSKVTGYTALDDLMGKGSYAQEVRAAADDYLKELDKNSVYYTEPYGMFVYTRDVPMMQGYLSAYEATGESKYLDAAKEVGELIMATLWTTGYHNDYAVTDYTVDPETVYDEYMVNDGPTNWYMHKNGTAWRVGNPYGVSSKVYEPPYTQNKIQKESAPGWVPARTGFSTEHTMTPTNRNAITMNMWAGSMLRLGQYTRDDFMITQARNAMIGRFANYSGYYYERYLLHDKQADFPYKGPDTNQIYWHHIPVFLGLLEDFLINNIWQKSNGNIEFPTAVNQGYAYFVTNQYGFAPGKFYDQSDMWLWLDRGIAQPDSVEIDYLPAKKDGVLGIAFVNEGATEKTTTITLGDKIPNAANLSTTATLYDKDGNQSEIQIENGKFTLTIPAKGIRSVVLNTDVKKPAFAKPFTPSVQTDQTAQAFKNGKAYLLQFNDQSYYAYLYTTLMAENTKSVTFTYTYGGKTESQTITEYPFEVLVKVPASTDFSFAVTAVQQNGTQKDLGGGTLKPFAAEQATPYQKGDVVETNPRPETFPNFEVILNAAGNDSVLRFVCDATEAPFVIQENTLTGLKIKGVIEDKKTGHKVLLESMIVGNEMRANGDVVLRVNPTTALPMDNYHYKHKEGTPLTIISPDKDYNSVKVENENQIRSNIWIK